jgi:hypothetical protein
MSRFDILSAWKKAPAAGASAHAVGAVELTDAEAATVDGKLAIAICSGCHGCTKVPTLSYMSRINPPALRTF